MSTRTSSKMAPCQGEHACYDRKADTFRTADETHYADRGHEVSRDETEGGEAVPRRFGMYATMCIQPSECIWAASGTVKRQ